MKFKRIVSKILACAMVVTSVYTGNVANVNAADQILQPLAKYDFEAGVTDDNGKYKEITLVDKDLNPFAGNMILENTNGAATGGSCGVIGGRNGGNAFSTRSDSDKAGLVLPQQNLTEYTVSLWMWREWNSLDSTAFNFVLMSIGTADKYVTLKNAVGTRSSNKLDVHYTKDGSVKTSEVIPQDSFWGKNWRMVTLTQSGDTVTVYVEGEQKFQTTVDGSLLAGEGNIMIGAQQTKNGSSACLFDDISVYNIALDGDEVKELFEKGTVVNKHTPDKIFDAQGISLVVTPEDGVISTGGTMQVQAVLPKGVPASDVTITYASSKPDVASVNSTTGVVTGLKKGTATITATAVMGENTKTATKEIEVKGTPEEILGEATKIDVTEALTLDPGDKENIVVTYPAGLAAADCTTSFAVEGTSDAVTVNAATGEITAVKAGTAAITTSVTIGDTTKTGTTTVKVRSASEILRDEEITVVPSLRVEKGQTAKINVQLPKGVSPDDANIAYAVKEGATAGVATVDANGVVTGVASGNTIITVTVTSKADATVSKSKEVVVRVTSAEEMAELAVEYDLSAAKDGKLVDISGHGNDADIKGTNATFSVENGENVMTLSANTYVELPKSIVSTLSTTEKFTIEARFAKNSSCGKNAWLFCLGANTKTNYLFVSPNFGNSGILRSGIKSTAEDSEILFETAKETGNDVFHTVDLVFNEGVVTLYMDGIQMIAPGGKYSIDYSGYKVKDDIIDKNTTETILGYIGKSLYPNDGYYQGKLSSFKIYNSAKTPEEIQGGGGYQAAFEQEVSESLTDEKFVANYLGSKNTSLDKVAYDMSLPKTINENAVTWTFNPEGIIEANGTVNNDETEEKTVAVTATVTSGSLTATKTFTVKVPKADRTALNKAIADAKAVDTTKYTEATVNNLTKALTAAEAQDLKGQTRIDSAASNLTRAINNLKKVPVTEVKLDQTELKLTVGGSATLKVTVNPSNAEQTVTWESNAKDVADVVDGKVTANKEGTAVITVTSTADKNKTATCTVTVKEKTVPPKVTVKSVKLNATKLTMGVKESYTLKATVTVNPNNASNKKVEWKSDKPKIVSVNNNGKITAKKTGKAKITVTSSANKNKKATVTVTVKKAPDKKAKVTLNKKTVNLKVKKTFQIKAKVSSKYGSATFKYTIDKKGKKAVTVDKNGKVTAKKKGTATITVKPYNGKGKSAKVKITVK